MTPLITKLRSAGEAERTLAPASGLFDEAADLIEKLAARLEQCWTNAETALDHLNHDEPALALMALQEAVEPGSSKQDADR